MPEAPDKSKDSLFEDINTSSFAFRPMPEPGTSFFFGTSSKVIILYKLYLLEHSILMHAHTLDMIHISAHHSGVLCS